MYDERRRVIAGDHITRGERVQNGVHEVVKHGSLGKASRAAARSLGNALHT